MVSQTDSAENVSGTFTQKIETNNLPSPISGPQIFVFGSLDIQASDEEREQFEDQCQALGKALAQRGFLISVASATTFTVDLHVLAGANDWCEGKPPLKVQFIGPAKLAPKEPPLKSDPDVFPNLDCNVRLLKGDWKPSHEKQLKEADGIILVGGNPHGVSIRVGSAAIERGIPFIPVPIFDGAGAELWESHSHTLKKLGISDKAISTMSEEFNVELIVTSLMTLMENRGQNLDSKSKPTQSEAEPNSDPPADSEEPKMTRAERLKLVTRLSAIPAPQFSQLLFSIKPPPGIVPAGGAQAAALMNWAEGPGGCGLTAIEKLLDTLTNSE